MQIAAHSKWGIGLSALALLAGAAALLLALGPGPQAAKASSHREAPLIGNDPTGDNTDLYAFVSPDRPNTVTMVADYIPFEGPAGGPNFYNFDQNALYELHVDSNGDGQATTSTYQFRFKTETRDTNTFGLRSYRRSRRSHARRPAPRTGTSARPTRSRWSTNGKRTVLANGTFAVPSNVGPRSMPNYAASRRGHVHARGGIKVFAGQRDDPFFVDLGAVFDTLDLRRSARTCSPGCGVDGMAAPTSRPRVQVDLGDTGTTTIGAMRARAGRRSASQANGDDNGRSGCRSQRLANPLVNEVIIAAAGQGPLERDRARGRVQQFLHYYLKPRLALALQLVFAAHTGCTPFGDASCVADSPAARIRASATSTAPTLVNVLLKYQPGGPTALRTPAAEPERPAHAARVPERLTVLAATTRAGRTAAARTTTSPTWRCRSSAACSSSPRLRATASMRTTRRCRTSFPFDRLPVGRPQPLPRRIREREGDSPMHWGGGGPRRRRPPARRAFPRVVVGRAGGARGGRSRPRASAGLSARLEHRLPRRPMRRSRELQANPRDEHSYALLGLAYQQRARETGDPTYYTKSGERAATARCALAPNDLLATSGLGSLALSRHRFREALALGRRRTRALADDGAQLRRDRRRARRARPLPRRRSTPSTRWPRCGPSLSSYARVSHARELLGDVPPARSAR